MLKVAIFIMEIGAILFGLRILLSQHVSGHWGPIVVFSGFACIAVGAGMLFEDFFRRRR